VLDSNTKHWYLEYMKQSVASREAKQARAIAFLARPARELESAADRNGQTVRVGDTVEFAPGRTTVVTRIYQDPTSTAAYEAPTADVTNRALDIITVSEVQKV